MANRLPAGQMRHVVTIKRHKIEGGTTAYDTYGQLSASSTAWTASVERRAAIEHLTGDEALLARQLYAKATYRITIDYDPTVASTGGSRQAVFYGTRQFHVGAVINPGLDDEQLQLLVGEER